MTYSQKEFEKCWFSTKEGGEEKGTVLALIPTPEFETQGEEKTENARSLLFFARYLSPYKRQIVLHMNTRINISLISDFLIKLMRLPLHFFDTKMIGDIM